MPEPGLADGIGPAEKGTSKDKDEIGPVAQRFDEFFRAALKHSPECARWIRGLRGDDRRRADRKGSMRL